MGQGDVGETGAAAPSDHPTALPYKPAEGRGPEQLLKDQMDDHSTWEILNCRRNKSGDPSAEAVSSKDELRLRTTAAKHTLDDETGVLCRRIHLPLESRAVPVLPNGGGWRQWAFQCAHDAPLAGHLNASKTFDKLRRCVVWGRMLQDCEFWVESCDGARSTVGAGSEAGAAYSWPVDGHLHGFHRAIRNPMGTVICARTLVNCFGYHYSNRGARSNVETRCKRCSRVCFGRSLCPLSGD